MPVEAMQSKLMDSSTYMYDVGAGGVGYMAPYVVDNLADRLAPFDVPGEMVGLGTLVLLYVYGGEYGEQMAVGSGAYTAERAAERVGVRDTIVNLGA